MFTIVSGVLWKPLPYADSERLVMFNEASLSGVLNCSYPNLEEWRQRSALFEDIALAREFPPATLRLEKSTESIPTGYAHPNLFTLLRVQPVLGRLFTAEEDSAGAEPVGLITHRAWQRFFEGDPAVVGRHIRIHVSFEGKFAQSMIVGGVLPADFRYENIELWLPLNRFWGAIDEMRDNHWFRGIGKLKPGVRLSRARAALDGIARDLERQYPATNRGVRPRAAYLNDYYAGRVKTPLLLLLGAVGFVMLIACGNAVHLVLTRTLGRSREIAVRLALGATRGRLLQLLLAESLWIAVAGGLAGVLLSYWGVAWAIAAQPRVLPRATIQVDSSAIFYALAVTGFTFLMLCLAPLWNSSELLTSTAVQSAGRGSSDPRQRRLGWGMVAAELAMASILLAGSGLMIESLRNLGQVNLGYRPDGVVAASLSLPGFKYSEEEQFRAVSRRILDEVKSIPGYESAALAEPFAVGGNGMLPSMTIPGRNNPSPPPMVPAMTATPTFLETMRIPLRAGRMFQDHAPTREAVVSEEFARRYFPGEDPVGKQIDMGGPMPIVGVAANTRLQGPLSATMPEVYWSQNAFGAPALLLRTTGPPAGVVAALREAVKRAEPEIRSGTVRPLAEIEFERTAVQRFTRSLLMIFAGLAVLLASLGIYGVVSYTVEQRTREIGIRMALGATRKNVGFQFMKQTLSAAAVGAIVGAAGTIALAKFLSAQLYGVTAHEPAVYVAATGLLVVVAVAASGMPVLRASRIDPVVCLRQE